MSQVPYLQVALVPDEHNCHIRVCVLPGVFKPARQVVERLASVHGITYIWIKALVQLTVAFQQVRHGDLPGNVIHQQRASSSAVIRAGDGTEGLLPSLQAHGRS